MYTSFLLTLLLNLTLQNNPSKHHGDEKAEIRWMSIEEAMNLSAQNPKLIMIDFYTDWCGWCKKLDQTTYADKEVITYINENFYAVKFDAEQKADIQFLGKKYSFVPSGSRGTHQFASMMANRNGRIGYPTITFLDENGKRIAVEAGYKDVAKMSNLMRYYADGFYLEMNFNDFVTKQAEENSAE